MHSLADKYAGNGVLMCCQNESLSVNHPRFFDLGARFRSTDIRFGPGILERVVEKITSSMSSPDDYYIGAPISSGVRRKLLCSRSECDHDAQKSLG